MRLKGAKLSTPKSFSCKQAVVEAIVITEIANLFDNNETEIRQSNLVDSMITVVA